VAGIIESSIFIKMADGRKKNGGARPGAGRKTKAQILGLAELIDTAWPADQQTAVIKKLAEDCNASDFHTRHESRKLLLSYKFGKPTEKREHIGELGIRLLDAAE
jgi:hypothetical protein